MMVLKIFIFKTMPILPFVNAGIQAGSAALGYFGQREANRTNIELAREGQEFEKEMWNRNNEYNTPKSQLSVYRDWETDRKSTRLNSSHSAKSRMPSSA